MFCTASLQKMHSWAECILGENAVMMQHYDRILSRKRTSRRSTFLGKNAVMKNYDRIL